MKYKFWLSLLIGVVLGLLLLSLVSATWMVPAVDTYDLSWNTIAGGGASFTSAGNYSLGATIGQSSSGPMSGTAYHLDSGFWLPGKFSSYLPLVSK
jgi:hypothetical protein